jgi:hypothetical protein
MRVWGWEQQGKIRLALGDPCHPYTWTGLCSKQPWDPLSRQWVSRVIHCCQVQMLAHSQTSSKQQLHVCAGAVFDAGLPGCCP